MLKFIVNYSLNEKPLTVKDYVRYHLKFSLTAWRKLKASGSITLNGETASPISFVFPQDILLLNMPTQNTLLPIAGPLAICYEDEYLLAVNKPSGLLVHPTSTLHETTLANLVLYYYQQQGLLSDFHPIHRLDRNTSGLLLIAKHAYIQQMLATSSLKSIARQYLALVTGELDCSGEINAPIARKPGSIIERTVSPNGQEALTHYEVVQTYRNATLLRLILATGRTHQIRVHLSHLGYPLLGDDLYGGQRTIIQRQALHSASLTFPHPITNEMIRLFCPIPPDMLQAIQKLQRK
ncbi:MAG: RluA family pseudouridine synthase [Sporomusaceae bacterium]|nr:RluA family pseudouridine synthase [Sporomusaceae bacterium]